MLQPLSDRPGKIGRLLRLHQSFGLRLRMVMLGVVTMVPIVILVLSNAHHSSEQALEEARIRAQLLVIEENERYDNLIQQSRLILDFVSHAPEATSGAGCSAFLADTKQRYGFLSALFITDAKGDLRCSSIPVDPKISPRDREYFRQALETKRLSISNFIISKVSQKPVIALALPVLDATGEVERVVAVAISVQALNELLANDSVQHNLSADTSTTILDGNGVIVARYPSMQNCIGEKVADQKFAQVILQEKHGQAELPGLMNEEQLLAFQPFAGTPSYIAVGILKAPIVAAIRHRLRQTLSVIFAVIAGSIILGLVGTEYLILRPGRLLADIARQIGHGNYDLPTLFSPMPEVQVLQKSFVVMARRLKDREVALRTSEASVQESNRNLLLAEQMAHIGHWRVDMTTNEVNWSDEVYRIHGRDPADYTPNLDDTINAYHPDDRATVRRLVEWAIGFTREFEYTLRIVRPDGELRHVESRGFCELGPNGEIVSLFGIIADITALKETEIRLKAAQQAAEAANSAKSEFLSNMSHEIRTPLTSIIGFSSLLMAQNKAPELRRYLELQHNSGQHLLTLVNDLLDHSKIEAGMVEIDHSPFALATIFQTCHDLLLENARRKQIELSLDIDPALPATVVGDATRIQQIILNLGGNALKFTPSGQVRIVARVVSSDEETVMVRIAVEDSGIGMTPEQLENVFQRYHQAESSIARRFGGTGLGLAISKGLVAAMQGRMGAESRPGAGSTFWFEIPLGAAAAAALPQVAVDGTPCRPANILLVEDSVINQALFQEVLGSMGHEVTIAGDGQMALYHLTQPNKFEIVLMDMEMPVMDGLTAARQLRQQGITLPIIAISANTSKLDAARCEAAGMNEFLSKPVDFPKLQLAIEGVLASAAA